MLGMIWRVVISLYLSDGVKYVTRRIEEYFYPKCLTHKSKGVEKMCVINGNINAQIFINKIHQSELKISARDL